MQRAQGQGQGQGAEGGAHAMLACRFNGSGAGGGICTNQCRAELERSGARECARTASRVSIGIHNHVWVLRYNVLFVIGRLGQCAHKRGGKRVDSPEDLDRHLLTATAPCCLPGCSSPRTPSDPGAVGTSRAASDGLRLPPPRDFSSRVPTRLGLRMLRSSREGQR